MKRTIQRVKSVPEADYKTKCISCGKNITLKFNSGELDRASCCGFNYELESKRIDFVIKRSV